MSVDEKKVNEAIKNREEEDKKKVKKIFAIARNSSTNKMQDCGGFCLSPCPQRRVVHDSETLQIVGCPIVANQITFRRDKKGLLV